MSVPSPDPPAAHPDLQAAYAGTLVDELVRGGVVQAVVCPGSRSTPLALALAAHPEMAVEVRLDERSAGFTALGVGRATGRPAVVVTTSGTAAAELHPAMVEADLSGVPLIAVTADRPPELQDVGAPQTIDQNRLFGRSVRWFSDPGVASSASRPWWRSIASRAVAEATSGPSGPGPVHLNLPFREPLIGDPALGGGLPPGRAGGVRWHSVVSGPDGPGAAAVATLAGQGLHPGVRGLVVAGAGCGDPEAVVDLATSLGWPVLADPRSGLRFPHPLVVGAADGILRSRWFADGHRPDFVLRLGERWVSKVVNGFLAEAVDRGASSFVVEPFGRWPDPEGHTPVLVRAEPTTFCRLVRQHLPATTPGGPATTGPGGWSDDWGQAEALARAEIERLLGSDGDEALTEPSLSHRLFGHLPGAATLVVSSSMPVRDIEAFATVRPEPPRVVANRGANGIDGVVSTALGVALGSTGPTVALVGDLAFLHDVSALVRAEGSGAGLTVVVADNAGGGIFSFLDAAVKVDEAAFETLFATPQSTDVAQVARGFGWEVDDLGPDAGPTEFELALDRRVESGARSVVRVRVPRRSVNLAVHQRINAAVAAAVDQAGR